MRFHVVLTNLEMIIFTMPPAFNGLAIGNHDLKIIDDTDIAITFLGNWKMNKNSLFTMALCFLLNKKYEGGISLGKTTVVMLYFRCQQGYSVMWEAHFVPALGNLRVEIFPRGLAGLKMMLLIYVSIPPRSYGFPQLYVYQSDSLQNLLT
jgi:hypothetical protein